jgi:hypothetical protein
MGIFQESSNWVYPTNKEKTPVVLTITGELKRVKSDNPKLNYKGANNEDKGYYDLMAVVDEEGNEKELKISTWAVYYLLRDLNPEIGDTIEITRPQNGKYVIVKK